MAFLKRAAVAATATAALLSSTARAEATRYCPQDGICFSVAIPTSSADANKGNIYFQMTAPTSYQWISLGTGSRMAGSNLFVMYQDGAGNVTISNREASSYAAPSVNTGNSASQLTLLAGSGVSGDTMTANVMCSNCESWSAGTLDLTSTSAGWVAAWKGGGSLTSKSVSQSISVHDDTSVFSLDLTKATVAEDANPFVSSSGNSSSSGGSGSSTGSGSSDSGTSGSSSSGVSVKGGVGPSTGVLIAHGVILALVMAVLYPVGSIMQSILKKWYIHAGWQMVGFLLMWIGFGTGVKAAEERMMLFQETHTVLGTIVICLFGIQPALGFAHHRHFVKHRARGIVSHVHIWYGRVLLVIGVANGGYGLKIAAAPSRFVIAYGVIAGILMFFYLSVIIWSTLRANGSAVSRGAESSFDNGKEAHPLQRRPFTGSV